MKALIIATVTVLLLSSNAKKEVAPAYSIDNKTWFFVVKAEAASDIKNRTFIAAKGGGATLYHKLKLASGKYKFDGDDGTFKIENSTLRLKSRSSGSERVFNILFSSADYLTLKDEHIDIGVFYGVWATIF